MWRATLLALAHAGSAAASQNSAAVPSDARHRPARPPLLKATEREILGHQHAVRPILSQQSEVWDNPYGGRRQRAVYTGVATFGFVLDLDALGWSKGTSVSARGLWIQGRNISPFAVGDAGIVSNIAGVATVRLYKWWFRQKFLGDTVDLKLGQISLDADFMYLDSAQLFINSGFGTLQTEALNIRTAIYPLGALGARLKLKPADSWTIMFGAYDGDAGTEEQHRHSSDLALSAKQGITSIAEISWENEVAGRKTRVSIGGYYDTGRLRDYEHGGLRNGLTSPYIMLESVLARIGGGKLTASAHGAFALPAARAFAIGYADAALVLGGAGWNRPNDDLGLGLASTHFGKPYVDEARRGGDAVTRVERVVELTYRAMLLSWLSLQPSAQWVFQPHYSGKDSLALGLRLTVQP